MSLKSVSNRVFRARVTGGLLLLMMLSACHETDDTLLGRWTVERVHVDFDENIATPEMVRQFGEMDRGNVVEISKDSALVFISNGDTVRGRASLRGHELRCDGRPFANFKDGTLVTEASSPLGKVTVRYSKARP